MTISGQADMKMAAVPSYVMEKTGLRRSRATIYNWATKDIWASGPNSRLKTEIRAGQMFTKPEWVDEFLTRLDQR